MEEEDVVATWEIANCRHTMYRNGMMECAFPFSLDPDYYKSSSSTSCYRFSEGIGDRTFTEEHIHNKDLVIQMLCYEEQQVRSDARYQNPLNRARVSLDNEYAFNRMTLAHFGFDTSDVSVDNYRKIFRTYFRSPTDYDKGVIASSHYMRNNTTPVLRPGDQIPDCPLYHLDGTTRTTLHQLVQDSAKTMICAFSLS